MTAHTPRLPLTAAQHGIWIGQQLDRHNPAYWTAEAVELHGVLNAIALEQAVRNTVAECEALHMRYGMEQEQVWQWRETAADWLWQELDCSTHASPDAAWQAAQDWMLAQLQVAADPARDCLFGSALIRLAPDRHLWFFRAHHLVLDGYGFALLARRIASWYDALLQDSAASAPARAPGPLTPVIVEDLAYPHSTQYEQDAAFWHACLRDAPAPPQLKPPQPVSHTVARVRTTLPEGTFTRWQQGAVLAQCDWVSWLLASVCVWLYQNTGRTDLLLGLPVMGRLGSAALNVPCMFMNIVPLRVRFDPADTRQKLAGIIAQELKAMRPHQRYRYEQLKRDLHRLGDERRLFGPVINIMPFDRPLKFADLRAHSHPVSAGPVEDLAISIAPLDGQVRVDVEGNGLAWTRADLQQQRHHLCALLEQAGAQRHVAVNAVPHPCPPDCTAALLQGEKLPAVAQPVLQRLLQQVRLHPNAIALEQPDSTAWTYTELLQQIQHRATQLRAQGVCAGQRVALVLPRTPDTIATLLAVLWCGAAWVPLDPAGPEERRKAVLDHAQPHHVISVQQPLTTAMQPGANTAPFTPESATPAYLIYTSGSTGTPNGVVIGHDALAHFVAAASARYGISASDRILQFAPLHFDACVEEIFLALCNGARLVLRTDAMLESMPAFVRACSELEISVLDLPTAFWHELVFSLAQSQITLPDSLRLVIIGGEAAQPQHLQTWREKAGTHITLLNTYGPTETTVVCSSAVLAGPQQLQTAHHEIAIGTPLPGVHLLAVDDNLQPVPAGEAGELCVLGPTLAQGYFRNPPLTAQRFVNLPCLPDAPRAYRTGDRVRIDAGGQLHFLGRLDDEIKISGHRVAPAAVETVLSIFPGLNECAVILVTAAQQKNLVAFVVASAVDLAALRAHVTQHLYAAAVPAHIIAVDALPRNANGKIDRRQLQQQWLAQRTEAAVATAPAESLTPAERQIIRVWQDVLPGAQLHAHSNFFELGGSSLQAIQVINRLNRQCQCELAVSTLFRHATIAALARVIESRPPPLQAPAAGDTDASLAPLLRLQDGTGPTLFCIHPADGVTWCYLGLLPHLPDIPVWGLQADGLTGTPPDDFETLIQRYLQRIRAVQAKGPYRLLGWSSGGGIAHAIATQLQQQGETIELLALMDAYPAQCWRDAAAPQRRDALRMLLDSASDAFDAQGMALDDDGLLQQVLQKDRTLAALGPANLQRMIDTTLHNMQLYRQAEHGRFDGDLLFFRAARRLPGQPEYTAWQAHVSGRLHVQDIDCDHFAMHTREPVARIGAQLAAALSGSAMKTATPPNIPAQEPA